MFATICIAAPMTKTTPQKKIKNRYRTLATQGIGREPCEKCTSGPAERDLPWPGEISLSARAGRCYGDFISLDRTGKRYLYLLQAWQQWFPASSCDEILELNSRVWTGRDGFGLVQVRSTSPKAFSNEDSRRQDATDASRVKTVEPSHPPRRQ